MSRGRDEASVVPMILRRRRTSQLPPSNCFVCVPLDYIELLQHHMKVVLANALS